MHFIDRDNFKDAPLDKLKEYQEEYKNNLPNSPKPKWNNDKIRVPLGKLFLNNCAYCGIYTDIGSDAEVDHFCPKNICKEAEKVFGWENYVWSCHPCNNYKRENHPFLNPCSKDEMKWLYFNHYSGKYFYHSDSPKDIIKKYNLTNRKSYINGKNRPNRRKIIAKRVDSVLKDIKLYSKLIITKDKLDKSLKDLKDIISEKDYLLLIKFLIKEFINNNDDFNYKLEELFIVNL